MKDIAEKSLFDIPGGWKTLLWILVLLGIGMFIAGLMTGGEESVVRTWQACQVLTTLSSPPVMSPAMNIPMPRRTRIQSNVFQPPGISNKDFSAISFIDRSPYQNHCLAYSSPCPIDH